MVLESERVNGKYLNNCYFATDFSKTITQESFPVSLAKKQLSNIGNLAIRTGKYFEHAFNGITYVLMEKTNNEHKIPNWTFHGFKDCTLQCIKDTARDAKLNAHWVGFVERIREYNNLSKEDKIPMSVVSRDDSYMIELFEKYNRYLKDMNIYFDEIRGNTAFYDSRKLTGGFDRSMNSSNKWQYLNNLKQELKRTYPKLENLVYMIDGEWERLRNNHKNDFYIARIKDPGGPYF